MFIEALLYGALRMVSGIGRTVQDEQSKRDSIHVNDKGQTVCYGRTGQQYINDERTYRWSETDKYGHRHNLIIGVNSGKVYDDDYKRKREPFVKMSEENKQRAIKNGKLAYKNFDPRFKIPVTTEIQTGKVITCLYKGKNKKGVEEYRKWYLTKEVYEKCPNTAYYTTAPGDYGIVITKDEYDKLGGDYADGVSRVPSDDDVREKLWSMK